jgi:hypothetical protein
MPTARKERMFVNTLKINIMKPKFKIPAKILMLVFGLLLASSVRSDPPLPPISGGHGRDANQPPVGAPIDGGLGILMILAGSSAYGGVKLYRARKREEQP